MKPMPVSIAMLHLEMQRRTMHSKAYLSLGFFMLSPKAGELDRLRQIVAKQQEKAKDLPYPHFDENRGWGHVIRPPDEWWTINKKNKRRRYGHTLPM